MPKNSLIDRIRSLTNSLQLANEKNQALERENKELRKLLEAAGAR